MEENVPVPQGKSVPFEIKGGSPMILHVELPTGRYELRVAPMVFDVRHLPNVTNLQDPTLPSFSLQLNMQVATNKL